MVESSHKEPEEAGNEDPKVSPNDDVVKFEVDEIEFHENTPESVVKEGIAREYNYARLGLIVGALTVALGAVLIVLGYSGSVDITFKAGSNTGHVVTGSLGVVIALVGFGILFWTRPKVTAGRKTSSSRKKTPKSN